MRKISVFLITLAALPLVAQPVFTADNLPEIGYEAMFKADTSEEIIVDVGATGAPQTWDFSRAVEGTEVPFEVLDLEDTPAGDSFSTVADFVYHIDRLPINDTMSVESWQYLKVTPSELLMVGDYNIVFDSMALFHDYEPDRTNSSLPVQMEAQWQDSYYTADTLDETGLIVLEMWGASSSEVDAWGSVTVPAGTFEALRYVTYDTTITLLTIFVPGDPDTTATINYTWAAADVGPVMMIRSRNWETDPEFDTAGTYVVLTENNLTPGIEETKMTAPPEIRIRDQRVFFHTAQAGVVELDLYDAGGRRAASLCHGTLPAGKHSLPLPADLLRGVYFVQMRTSTGSMTGKFVVLD